MVKLFFFRSWFYPPCEVPLWSTTIIKVFPTEPVFKNAGYQIYFNYLPDPKDCSILTQEIVDNLCFLLSDYKSAVSLTISASIKHYIEKCDHFCTLVWLSHNVLIPLFVNHSQEAVMLDIFVYFISLRSSSASQCS